METKVNTNIQNKQDLGEITVELRIETVEILKAFFKPVGMIKKFIEAYPNRTRHELAYLLKKHSTKLETIEDLKEFYNTHKATISEYVPFLKDYDGSCKEL